MTTWMGRAAAAGACTWVFFLLAAPLQAAGLTLSAATYAVGSLICHQQAARSFHIGAAQIPVCARCLGLYAGVAVGAVVAIPLHGHRRALVVSALPTLLTWAVEAAGLAHASNVVRAVAAVPLGLVVATVVVAAADGR